MGVERLGEDAKGFEDGLEVNSSEFAQALKVCNYKTNEVLLVF